MNRVRLDRYGQLRHDDLVQVVTTGTKLRRLEPLAIASLLEGMMLDQNSELSDVWSEIQSTLKKWLPNLHSMLVVVFTESNELMGGILMLGNHSQLTMPQVINLSGTIREYYRVADCAVDYYVVTCV